MPQVSVRPATIDDVEFLSRTVAYSVASMEHSAQEKAEWLAGFREDTREQMLGLVEDSLTYVVEADGERVGRLRVVRTADRVFVAGIQIRSAHQGKGIGTAVLTGLLKEARDKGVPAELHVSKDDPAAERLYTRLGFRRCGEQGDDYLMTTTSR
ncbi:GNAT family N-acetyltransferase [Actinopolymorpha pittospori]|uniref:GNAT family N-acetyltransferase n=1 Tax=Actinopolymorpha pittospori TaxID=648752 RepID=UPI001EE3419D|nr:GNAT family N-acetyltransferase [Actinopolymorpha pittospori]